MTFSFVFELLFFVQMKIYKTMLLSFIQKGEKEDENLL